jgi:hypothetical protein
MDTDGTVGVGFYGDSSTGYTVSSNPTAYDDGVWHYLVGVRSAGALTLYIDGKQVNQSLTAESTTYYCCENNVALANDPACHCAGFTGSLSELAFYNYALSASQVAAHYAAAAPSGSTQVMTRGVIATSVSNTQLSAGGATYPTAQVGHATFDGDITPGLPAPNLYWFDYWKAGGVVHETQHEPWLGLFVPVQDSGGITPYVPWSYQLVVKDTTGKLIKGSVQAFVPGNLIIPEQFTAEGGFDLTIICSKPCAALTPSGSSKEVKGIAFGGVGIGSFDPSTGSIGGVGKILTFTGGRGIPHLDPFAITSGSVALEGVKIAATPVFGSHLSPFELDGFIDNYNGPNFNLDGSEYYEPIISGTVPGGGVWEACYNNFSGCVPPQNGDKTLANNLSTSLGLASVGTIFLDPPIGGAVTILGGIISAIAADPPDRHIHRTPQPLTVSRILLHPGHGLSPRGAAATSTVLNALDRAASVGQAFLEAIQRYQGAAAVGNPSALALQFEATLRYGHEFATLIRNAGKVINAQRPAILSSQLGRTRMSRRALIQLVRSVRRHGLPSAMVRLLTRAGLTATEMRDLVARISTEVPASGVTALGSVLDPAFTRQLRALATGLDRYLAGLHRQPLA